MKRGARIFSKRNDRDIFVIYKDIIGEWRWKLSDINGKQLGKSSEGYKNYADCEAIVNRLLKNKQFLFLDNHPPSETSS